MLKCDFNKCASEQFKLEIITFYNKIIYYNINFLGFTKNQCLQKMKDCILHKKFISIYLSTLIISRTSFVDMFSLTVLFLVIFSLSVSAHNPKQQKIQCTESYILFERKALLKNIILSVKANTPFAFKIPKTLIKSLVNRLALHVEKLDKRRNYSQKTKEIPVQFICLSVQKENMQLLYNCGEGFMM